jgi:hypothetical protein
VNENKKVYIYDKIKDRIDEREFSAASICYIEHGNRITHDSKQFTVLENIYHNLEEYSKNAIKVFSTALDVPDKHTESDLRKLLLFINQIFWRTPANYDYTNSLIEMYREKHPDWDTFVEDGTTFVNFSKEDRLKMIKLSLPSEIILRDENNLKTRSKYVSIQNNGPYLLSDNPIIYPKEPVSAEDFTENIIFPINKHRLYLSTTKLHKGTIGPEEQMRINVQFIFQARQYVIGDDYEDLHVFVDSYRRVRDSDMDLASYLFETIIS